MLLRVRVRVQGVQRLARRRGRSGHEVGSVPWCSFTMVMYVLRGTNGGLRVLYSTTYSDVNESLLLNQS